MGLDCAAWSLPRGGIDEILTKNNLVLWFTVVEVPG